MSAWPEAVYIINKIEDTLLEIQSFDSQLAQIEEANGRISRLENQADGYDSTLNEYAQQIDELRIKSREFDDFIETYQESDVSDLGEQISDIEDKLTSKEGLIAFKDTQDGEAHTKITSTGCIWFIEE